MSEILKDYKKGFSKETIILPTFLIQSGFFRNRTNQIGSIDNKIRSEIIELNNIQADLKFGILIFSEMLKTHQNKALKHRGADNNPTTLKFGLCSDNLVKACKTKSNYTISQVSEGIELFCKDLAPENEISITKNNKQNTFSIFNCLVVDSKKRTVTFRFSDEFIAFLNNDNSAITYINIDDFIKVGSNKTGGSIFLMTQSVSNLRQDTFFLTKYLSQALGIHKNCNKLFNNAFENLENKGLLNFEKVVTATPVAEDKWIKWSLYKIKSIAKSVVKKASNTLKELKKIPKSIEINSRFKNTKEGRKVFKSLMNPKSEQEITLDLFNVDYLDYVKVKY